MGQSYSITRHERFLQVPPASDASHRHAITKTTQSTESVHSGVSGHSSVGIKSTMSRAAMIFRLHHRPPREQAKPGKRTHKRRHSHFAGRHHKELHGKQSQHNRSQEEMDRMDNEHYRWLEFFKTNYLAPIHRPQVILDVGTGTGLWLLKYRYIVLITLIILGNVGRVSLLSTDRYDLYYQSPMSVIPPNCQFQEMDLCQGLQFADRSVDYIHHRNIYMIPMDKWPIYIVDCARILRPSGWLEIMETDYMLRRTGPEGTRFNKLLRRTIARDGVKARALTHIANWMASDAELDNVETRAYELPLLAPSNGMVSASTPAISLSTPELNNTPANTSCVSSGSPLWDNFYEHMLSYYSEVEAACEIELDDWKSLLDAVAVEARIHGTFILYMVVLGQKPGCPPTPI
ncbi:hypothetical protein BDF22DRAFT_697582 [Syncephalis plumigaleata]|nr:hypothetical protein BDF22DRAFT_697582 [Syncephalis plumigaleata]